MKIAIIGMGYVGLPLSIEFAKLYETIGFDINKSRIDELLAQKDSTLEVTSSQLIEAKNLSFTLDLNDIKGCNIYTQIPPCGECTRAIIAAGFVECVVNGEGVHTRRKRYEERGAKALVKYTEERKLSMQMFKEKRIICRSYYINHNHNYDYPYDHPLHVDRTKI